MKQQQNLEYYHILYYYDNGSIITSGAATILAISDTDAVAKLKSQIKVATINDVQKAEESKVVKERDKQRNFVRWNNLKNYEFYR